MQPKIDLTGQRFTRWTVISKNLERSVYEAYWNCICDCGNIGIIRGSSLRQKQSQSCGCLSSDVTTKRITKHNMYYTRIYSIYTSMKQRCLNKNHEAYNQYGGRGIKICDRWLQSFENFYADMGDLPTNKHQIDRINNDGNYEPGNCRWATVAENSRNKKTTRFLTFGGKTQCLMDWALENKLHFATLSSRLRYGWSIEKALLTPVQKRRVRNEHN